MSKHPVMTIGHSTHPIDVFIALLKQHGVTALADVRSSPRSRFNPQFNKEDLQASLKAAGIKYVFLGRELGARSEDPDSYVAGRVQYDRLANTESFQQGIERVMRGAEQRRVALMCAEKEPLDCHRTLLVARRLVEHGEDVIHILADGRLEPHAVAMDRLLALTGLPREDLFRSHDELIAEAIRRQEAKVAYVDERLANEGTGEAI